MQAKPRVAHNADLVSINIPRLTDVDQLSITGNKGLASVSFEALERANRLRIADNGFLTTLDGAWSVNALRSSKARILRECEVLLMGMHGHTAEERQSVQLDLDSIGVRWV